MDAPKVLFLDPEAYPPPKGRNLILKIKSGCETIGHWSDLDCVAWYPIPALPEELKVIQSLMNVAR